MGLFSRYLGGARNPEVVHPPRERTMTPPQGLVIPERLNDLTKQFELRVTAIVDDSSSIQTYQNTADVIAWHNEILKTLSSHPRAAFIRWRTRFLTSRSLSSHSVPVKQAPHLNEKNYHPVYNTPLYDTAYEKLKHIEQRQKEIGPENYFLSSEEGDTILAGAYAIRVHYYADHQATTDVPTRPVTWRVTFIVNEGTPDEKRDFKQGVIATANSGNATPGSSGTDWADVAAPTL